jgi:hypothetical protein
VRVPDWITAKAYIAINGEIVASGGPGTYVALPREWQDGDRITFEFPMQFRTVQYTGLEQAPDNRDRFALFNGPNLLALIREDGGEVGLPNLAIGPDALVRQLEDVPGEPLNYRIAGHPGWRYRAYWMIDEEPFNCFPVVEDRSAP